MSNSIHLIEYKKNVAIVDLDNVDLIYTEASALIIATRNDNVLRIEYDPKDHEDMTEIVKSMFVKFKKHRETMIDSLTQ